MSPLPFIKAHSVLLLCILLGLSGGIFTGLLGLLLGLLLEPLAHQYVRETQIRAYLIDPGPELGFEPRPGITAFCGLGVLCISQIRHFGSDFELYSISETAANLFHCADQDRPYLDQVCRIARDNWTLLNTDLLSESLKARIDGQVKTSELIQFFTGLSPAPSLQYQDTIDRISRVVAPEELQKTTGYPWDLLGVSSEASVQDIKRAFRRLALQFHPDSLAALTDLQKETAAESFIRIRLAYRKALSLKNHRGSG